MKLNKTFYSFLFIVLALWGLIVSLHYLKDYRRQLPPLLISRQALEVGPNFLKVISGEFRELLADYLLLKAAIIDGGEPEKITAEDWYSIYILYKQSMALDPLFFTTAYYTQGNLVWKDGMAEKAMALLEMSEKHRTWDWNPKWYLAFDYANFLNDKNRAAEYLFDAASMPDAPPVFAIMAARFKQGYGDTMASITMLKAMYEQTENEEFKSVLLKRIEAHTGVYILEQAIQAYRIKYGVLPETLKRLVNTGILSALPANPVSEEYVYDPVTGKVDYGHLR